MKLLFEYRFIIAVVLIVVLYAVFEWQKFKTILFALMLQAKDKAKDFILRGGQAQETWVIDKAYKFLPSRITYFIDKGKMRKIVHYLYVKARDKLDDGKINGSSL